jgi:hypothetical protein
MKYKIFILYCSTFLSSFILPFFLCFSILLPSFHPSSFLSLLVDDPVESVLISFALQNQIASPLATITAAGRGKRL